MKLLISLGLFDKSSGYHTMFYLFKRHRATTFLIDPVLYLVILQLLHPLIGDNGLRISVDDLLLIQRRFGQRRSLFVLVLVPILAILWVEIE